MEKLLEEYDLQERGHRRIVPRGLGTNDILLCRTPETFNKEKKKRKIEKPKIKYVRAMENEREKEEEIAMDIDIVADDCHEMEIDGANTEPETVLDHNLSKGQPDNEPHWWKRCHKVVDDMQMMTRGRTKSRGGHRPKDLMLYKQTKLEIYFGSGDQPGRSLRLAEQECGGKVVAGAALVGTDDPGINP